MMIRCIAFAVLCSARVYAADEGESCVRDGVPGVCISVKKCRTALDGWGETYRHPQLQICSYIKITPIICCLDNAEPSTAAPGYTTTMGTPTSSYNNSSIAFNLPTYETCNALPSTNPSPETGQKSWDKCVEYQQRFVYPCQRDQAGVPSRRYFCNLNATDELSAGAGGVDAAANEFRHMALLGVGTGDNTQWVCSGALISDRFILTVAHCSTSRRGPVTFAYIGALSRADVTDASKKYKIRNAFPHPEYIWPHKYNDIGLLETDKLVELNQYTVPACLHVGEPAMVATATVTAWWLRAYNSGYASGRLKKITLTKYTKVECSASYPTHKYLSFGFDEVSQLCFGNRESDVACQSEAGSPLQIRSEKMKCMHVVIGLASVGKTSCRLPVRREPSLYTRVSHYLAWIESVVWP